MSTIEKSHTLEGQSHQGQSYQILSLNETSNKSTYFLVFRAAGEPLEIRGTDGGFEAWSFENTRSLTALAATQSPGASSGMDGEECCNRSEPMIRLWPYASGLRKKFRTAA